MVAEVLAEMLALFFCAKEFVFAVSVVALAFLIGGSSVKESSRVSSSSNVTTPNDSGSEEEEDEECPSEECPWGDVLFLMKPQWERIEYRGRAQNIARNITQVVVNGFSKRVLIPTELTEEDWYRTLMVMVEPVPITRPARNTMTLRVLECMIAMEGEVMDYERVEGGGLGIEGMGMGVTKLTSY